MVSWKQRGLIAACVSRLSSLSPPLSPPPLPHPPHLCTCFLWASHALPFSLCLVNWYSHFRSQFKCPSCTEAFPEPRLGPINDWSTALHNSQGWNVCCVVCECCPDIVQCSDQARRRGSSHLRSSAVVLAHGRSSVNTCETSKWGVRGMTLLMSAYKKNKKSVGTEKILETIPFTENFKNLRVVSLNRLIRIDRTAAFHIWRANPCGDEIHLFYFIPENINETIEGKLQGSKFGADNKFK